MTCPCCGSARLKSVSIDGVAYRRCLRCRFLSRHHLQAAGEEVVAKHYDRVDPHRRVAESKRAFFGQALERLEQCRDGEKRILDVGCGYGYFLEEAAARGWQPFGLEISPEAAKESRRKFGDADIFLGKIEESGFAGEHFDAVTFWDVLVFAENPIADIAHGLRLLKPGGIVGIRVRNVIFHHVLYRLFAPFSFAAHRLGIKKPYVFHPNCFSPQSLRFLLKRAGFGHIRIENSPLTTGDPYAAVPLGAVAGLAKQIAEGFAETMRRFSREKWLWGPSLLIWARKP